MTNEISPSELMVILAGNGISWAIMLKNKNGPADIFKRLRKSPLIGGVFFTALLCAAISYGFIWLAQSLYSGIDAKINPAVKLSLEVLIYLVIFLMACVTGITNCITKFFKKVIECAACSPIYICAIGAGAVLLLFKYTIYPAVVFGAAGYAYVGLSMLGTNDTTPDE